MIGHVQSLMNIVDWTGHWFRRVGKQLSCLLVLLIANDLCTLEHVPSRTTSDANILKREWISYEKDNARRDDIPLSDKCWYGRHTADRNLYMLRPLCLVNCLLR